MKPMLVCAAAVGATLALAMPALAQAGDGWDFARPHYQAPPRHYAYPHSGYGYGYGYYQPQPQFYSERHRRKAVEFEQRRQRKEIELYQRGLHPSQLNPYYYAPVHRPRPRYYYYYD